MTVPLQSTGISNADVQLGCNIYYMNHGACIFTVTHIFHMSYCIHFFVTEI